LGNRPSGEAVAVSLPFKLIFFVLVDGWTLVAGSLIQNYGT
jgi:flagellar biosynthetic protein FliP